jgi:hypothetical protein
MDGGEMRHLAKTRKSSQGTSNQTNNAGRWFPRVYVLEALKDVLILANHSEGPKNLPNTLKVL